MNECLSDIFKTNNFEMTADNTYIVKQLCYQSHMRELNVLSNTLESLIDNI